MVMSASPIVRNLQSELSEKPFVPLMEVYGIVTDALDADMTLGELHTFIASELNGRIPAPIKKNAAAADTTTALDGRSAR